MDVQGMKEKLKSYSKRDIVFTDHAEIQAIVRNIEKEEVKENLVNPRKLSYVGVQNSPKGEKYECYFAYSEDFAHKYAISTNGKIIIITVIRINRNWRRTIK
ncbi:MAG: hypothetical protein ABEI74_00440 [Candidatus Pacearchaeota archaeon]